MNDRLGRRPRKPAKRWGQWTEVKALNQHVFVVRGDDGATGVLKEPKRRDRSAPSRLATEARNMVRLSKHHPGIVPVLDCDPNTPPAWYVTAKGVPLRDDLGDTPDLAVVVDAVRSVAETLLALDEEGTSHRDLKPDNLIVLDGIPRLIDFELATFPDRDPLTRERSKVGPAVFLAPEMREFDPNASSTKADVYSLGKTLFALARPEDGEYPPDGHHAVGDDNFSLYWQGGDAATDLELILDQATLHNPDRRTTLVQFHRELCGWLELHPVGSIVRPERTKFQTMRDPGLRAATRRTDRQIERLKHAVRTTQRNITSSVGYPLSYDPASFADLRSDHDLPDVELDSHVLWRSTYGPMGLRFILGLAVLGDDATLVLEVQPKNGDPVVTDTAAFSLDDVTRPTIALKRFAVLAIEAMR